MILSLLAAASVAAAPLEDPAAAFGTLPLFSDIEISPDGKNYAALVNTADGSGLGVFTLEGGFRYLTFIRDQDDLKVKKFFWKRDDRLVMAARVPGKRFGTPTVETRLFGLSPTADTELTYLMGRAYKRGAAPPQIQDNIISILPNDPEHVLLGYRPMGGEYTSAYKVKIDANREPNVVQRSIYSSIDFYADLTGRIRGSVGLRNEKELRLGLVQPDGKWKEYSHRFAEDAPNFRIAGFPNDPTKVYVTSDHETDTMALYLFDIPSDSFVKQLFSHPFSDVYGIRRDPKSGEAIGAIYGEDTPIIEWFSESKPKKTVAAIEQALGTNGVSFAGYNLSGSHALLFQSSGVEPGRYIGFEYATGMMTELPSQYPALEDTTLGEVIVTNYEARDGLNIQAFITLPPGLTSLEEAKSLPFALLPHGGPTARDFYGFDWLAQFLAHQGFGVMQMNFRGSSGYGDSFKNAGDRQWGQAMQDDITDGAKWLISEGMADAGKTSIIGASYGGYAALMGAVKTPDLYRCAVAINAVTDLPKILKDEKDYIGGSYGTRHIGRLWSDRKMLAENSPARRADEIKIPTLIVMSEEDRVVRPDHSEDMHRALKRAGKDVELVTLPKGSHFLNVGTNRITMLRKMDRFLSRCR